ncbi:hypothetical protein Eta_0028 [Serratia phage Eta]|uniref:EaA protein n=1 Tax=Serratia phage Eta TaxID=1282995 RepID=R9W0X9_9CAUD|nr:hypothetical protein Eta_0028 [Serratia phage Eta]AGN89474.1 hypothetical protein Eta_0028 [Serratia phage Eta]
MTLTTEQLKHILDNPNEFSLSRVQEMAAELLTNREAQPAMWVMSDDLTDEKIISTPAYPNRVEAEERMIGELTPLYTAPPAPAVPGIDELRLTFERSERESDDGFNLHKYGIGYADEATQARWESWLSCRAAMLAQPVSGGYTLNSPVIPDGWKPVPVEPTKEMINAALAAGCASIRSAYREMLAAAPEGGNG